MCLQLYIRMITEGESEANILASAAQSQVTASLKVNDAGKVSTRHKREPCPDRFVRATLELGEGKFGASFGQSRTWNSAG